MRRSTILVFLVFAVSGCGASDEERIRSTLEKFDTAIVEGDPKDACRQLVHKDDRACETSVTTRILELSDHDREATDDKKIKRIRIIGRVAEVTFEDNAQAPIRLRKDGRKWLIDSSS